MESIRPPDSIQRVFVVSDIRLYSEGLASLLCDVTAIEVIGAGATSDETYAQILKARPAVLIVDAVSLHRTDFVRRLTAALPSLLVVVCGVSEQPDEVIACAREGAAGYVHRDARADELIRTVKSVERGELPCSARVAAALFRRMALTDLGRAPGAALLTDREQEVIALIDRGMTNKEIAFSLGIELTTVKNHVHHILSKLKVSRRAAIRTSMRQQRMEGIHAR